MDRSPFSYEPPRYVSMEEPDSGEDMDYGVLGNVLSGAGNLINLPGSMVRDAISFSNPFDQLFTPFSDENRTSGAEISRYWMGGDENSGGNQMAGLLIDTLTDPLMLMTGGTAAAGKLGAKAGMSALRGAKGVGKAARGSYQAAKLNTPSARMAGMLDKSKNNTIDALARKVKIDDAVADAARRNEMSQGAYLGQGGGPATVSNLEELQTAAQAADDQMRFYADRLANRTKRLDRFKESRPIAIASAEAIPYVEGARVGAKQLGSNMYSGGMAGLRGIRDQAMGLGRRALGGDRNAMLQSAAIAGNTANAMGGLNMRDEPSLEDMIAQALMEDPDLSQQLLMMLSGE
jgi:hypothetical protein